jgi:hypothetical protein
MSLRDVTVGERLLDRQLEIQEPQRVGHGGPGLSNPGGDLILREPKLVRELPVGVGFFHCVQVRALDVLDERHGQLVSQRHLAHDRRHAIKAGHLRRPHTALAGHELVAVEDLGHEYRLENAVHGDAARQGLQGVLLDALTWLVWVAANPGDGDLHGRRPRRTGLGNQRPQSTSKPGVPLHARRSQLGLPPTAGVELPGAASAAREAGSGLPSRSRISAASAA